MESEQFRFARGRNRATNYAIEGPTGEWTRNVAPGLTSYHANDSVDVNQRTLQWVAAHATYDDKHPYEALELIKAHVSTREEQRKVLQAAKRAMEYYALALDACYEMRS